MNTCSINECTGDVFARRMCTKHYFRWRRHGDASTVIARRDRYGKTIEERLRHHTVTPDGCMRWNGNHIRTGYGMVTDRGKSRLAHRVAYEFWVGPIPDGLELDHLCCVRDCINPTHLEPVTHAENNRRAAARRRGDCKPHLRPTELRRKTFGPLENP